MPICDAYHIARFALSDWCADIESLQNYNWAALRVFNFDHAKTKPQALFFERGMPEVVIQIVHELAKLCGAFIVMYNGEKPTLVAPNITIEDSLKNWH